MTTVDTELDEALSSQDYSGKAPGGDELNPQSPSKKTTQKKPRRGVLLDLPPALAAKKGEQLWSAQNPHMRPLQEQWKANALRRKGLIGVQMQRTSADRNEWRVMIPVTATTLPPTMNKLARLARRLKANVFSDPYVPDPQPTGDNDEDKDGAEFLGRVLQDTGGTTGFNGNESGRMAFDRASTYGSGFVHLYVDPKGGGWRPVKKLASPQASSVQDAAFNPATGQVWGDEPVLRFVRADGTFTENALEAKREWIPALRREILDGRHVRFLPLGVANGIREAEGVMLGQLVRLGRLKKLLPDVIKGLSDDQLRAIAQYRPERPKELLPERERRIADPEEGKRPSDDTHIFVLTIYYRVCAAYPEGAYVVILGDKLRAVGETWIDESPDGEPRPLEIPVAQFAQFEDGEENPYRVAASEVLAGGNEIRAMQMGSAIEHLYRFNRRKVFYPVDSNYNPKSAQNVTGTYIAISREGEPKTEEIPEYPAISLELHDRTTLEMDDEIGLQQQAQAMNEPSVQSGVHAQQIMEAVLASLSDLKQNTDAGMERLWLIAAQLMRAFFSKELQLEWVTEDGQHKQRAFKGLELATARDIKVAKGSGTMLAPSAKAALATEWATTGAISPYEHQRMIRGQAGGLIGLQDNPHYLRVRRQIDRWLEGPPPMPELPPEMMQDPEGQLAMQQYEMMAMQLLEEIWAPRPNDQDPEVAMIRKEELSSTMSSTKYGKQPPFWRMRFDIEYMTAASVAAAAQAAAVAAESGVQSGGAGGPPGQQQSGEKKSAKPQKKAA